MTVSVAKGYNRFFTGIKTEDGALIEMTLIQSWLRINYGVHSWARFIGGKKNLYAPYMGKERLGDVTFESYAAALEYSLETIFKNLKVTD